MYQLIDLIYIRQFPLAICIKQYRNLYSAMDEGTANIWPTAAQT